MADMYLAAVIFVIMYIEDMSPVSTESLEPQS